LSGSRRNHRSRQKNQQPTRQFFAKSHDRQSCPESPHQSSRFHFTFPKVFSGMGGCFHSEISLVFVSPIWEKFRLNRVESMNKQGCVAVCRLNRSNLLVISTLIGENGRSHKAVERLAVRRVNESPNQFLSR
jgi:hypothetical protein